MPKVIKQNKKLTRLQIENVKASSIGPNDYNPNRQSDHDFWLLCKSMYEDGFTQPVIVQAGTDKIVDGEHRWTAWIVINALEKEHGPKAGAVIDGKNGESSCSTIRLNRGEYLRQLPELEIPVVKADMTTAQAMISTLRHNRARGSEDVQLAAQVLRDLRELGSLSWAQDSLILDDAEITLLLEDIPAPDALAGDEYGEAWQPSSESESSRGPLEGNSASATSEAVEEMRSRERALAQAKTEEERQALERDTKVYRLSLVFSGEQAETVRAVLAKDGAAKVLAFCESELQKASK